MKKSKTIFEKNVIEFVTVAAEYSHYIEQAGKEEQGRFIDTTLKLLPLLYLKALLLPDCELMDEDNELEAYVTEDIYDAVRVGIAAVLSGKDDYLDVFVEDMKYSDQPIARTISEDLADIYQDIKNFIFVFQQGINQTMNDALYLCKENFSKYWGQKLVNTLRALHDAKFAQVENHEDEDLYD